MSEENKRLETFDTYDFTKIIKNIEVSTAYIPGLQRITSQLILDETDRASDLPDIFKKFEDMVTLPIDDPKRKDLVFDRFESDLYTLYSLTQLFKYHAQEQNLNIKTKTTATQEDLNNLGDMLVKGQDITEQLNDINSKMEIVK
tara:strand:- start:383 stop:814 length:432 start_codon:yes stop_codon:yes gene_type:complete